ncbi:ABC transporter permease [Oceanobacillus picturae]|uniref:ABC transporter permease n=1 Tax=Oceanobacillus picturae TaxID=171693 RepID=W9AI77_9BACI|nr:hypothetical protein [Oceanobacillus picturae]RIU89358.1 hypothetical protein D1864_16055 [Oceanobacillus picturae]GAQ16302.1 ABC transporter permease [Oceanobacillus picturae]CDO02602.1 hypothetical protein BN988_01075 [Oceanobacillus picturae]
MKQTDKPYWRETVDCFLSIAIYMTLFFSSFVIGGHLTGTDWLGYFDHFTWTLNTEFFKDLIQSWK